MQGIRRRVRLGPLGLAAIVMPALVTLALAMPAFASRAQVSGGAGNRASALSLDQQARQRIPSRLSLGQQARRRIPSRLSLDQQAGQRIVYAYTGTTPPASLLTAIRSGEAAGVIFFADNIAGPGQLRAVIATLQQAAESSPEHMPLLMMTDQEGGEVRRLPGAPALSEKQIGESANALTLARQAGAGAAANLRGAGLNVNLAPVLDVFRAPGNFIDQFQRSYSSNPRTVAALGSAFITSQQAAGVDATAKHFPGLGAARAAQDTDVVPVTLNVRLGTLRNVDELPYRSAIAAGVRLVMVSWATFPALDPTRPAGLSSVVIGFELRGRLGFKGVTITDSLGVGGLERYGTIAHRGVLAAEAGADLLLCADTNGNTPADGLAVLRALASALGHGQLSETASQQSIARIDALRRDA